jgi:hypothetical protein
MADRVELLGPCDWWTSNVRSARWLPAEGEPLDVAVVLGPEVDGAAIERARERSRPWIGKRQPGVLPLLAVERVGTRAGWLYETFDGVSMGAMLRTLPGPLPQRLAAELVACCAEILEGLPLRGGIHPGLDMDDVLLRADGTVKLAGFVGPFARSPVHRDPKGIEDSATTVWRLGVLLAQLLTGSPPGTATDRVSHELVLRRLLIRIMSRPGPMFPERFRDWQCAMLAWSPEDRPVAARIAPALRELASTLIEPELGSWARERVPQVRRNPRPLEPPPPILELTEVPPSHAPESTEEATLSEDPIEDDVTAISTDGEPPRPFAPPERGTIPVHVGPPPEALPKVSSLPEELFGAPLVPTDPETPAPVSRLELAGETERGWSRVMGVVLALGLVALALAWYLWE